MVTYSTIDNSFNRNIFQLEEMVEEYSATYFIEGHVYKDNKPHDHSENLVQDLKTPEEVDDGRIKQLARAAGQDLISKITIDGKETTRIPKERLRGSRSIYEPTVELKKLYRITYEEIKL